MAVGPTYINTGQVRAITGDVGNPSLETARIVIDGPEGGLFDITDAADNQVYLRDPDTGGLGDPSPVARLAVWVGLTITNPRGRFLGYFDTDGTADDAEAALEAAL